jgi:hypothetical protein
MEILFSGIPHRGSAPYPGTSVRKVVAKEQEVSEKFDWRGAGRDFRKRRQKHVLVEAIVVKPIADTKKRKGRINHKGLNPAQVQKQVDHFESATRSCDFRPSQFKVTRGITQKPNTSTFYTQHTQESVDDLRKSVECQLEQRNLNLWDNIWWHLSKTLKDKHNEERHRFGKKEMDNQTADTVLTLLKQTFNV